MHLDESDSLKDEPEAPPRTRAVDWAMRIAAVSILVGCGATQYLAKAVSTQDGPARVASGADFRDPETTGSIAGSARSVALDPCGLRVTGR